MKKQKQDNFLLYVPVKRHELWEVRNEKVYLIFHHNRPIEKFAGWLIKKPLNRDLELDKIGSEVWQLIDGKRSVYEIGQEMRQSLGDQCEPLYDRLVRFLGYLNRKGWTKFERGNQELKHCH